MPIQTRSIGGLEIPKQYRKRSGLTKEIKLIGWDTETIGGKAVLLCNSEGHKKELHGFDDVLSMLTQKKYRGIINLFYNIAYDVTALVKWTPINCQKMLLCNGKMPWKKFVLKYIPKKQLTITSGKHTYKFQDLYQFYEISLEEAARRFL